MKIKLKLPLKISIIYILFGFLFLIFSHIIPNLISENLYLSYIFQTYKGIFFILFTGILLFKALTTYLEKEQKKKDIIAKKYFKLEQINNNMNHFFYLSMKMLDPNEYDRKKFIKEIFRIASTIPKKNDFGSAYIIHNGKIEYVDSIGFDLKELNEKDKDIDLYEISPEKVIVNRRSTLKGIKESIYVGIYKDQNIIGGFSLDISKSSNKSFSDEIINRIQMIQDLSNGFYKIKKSDEYRTMLQNDIVRSFITALEFHDVYTKGHSELVAMYSMKIGRALKLNKKQLENLYWSAVMHDIGKIIIPSDVLNKKEELTDSEIKLIRKHPQIGYEIISKSKTLQDVSKYILFHHEHWDGTGYPNGLKGDEIPFSSQIICVADSWHAMTWKRAYKKILTDDEGIKELLKNRGTQFSPKIVDIFIDKKLYLIDKSSHFKSI